MVFALFIRQVAVAMSCLIGALAVALLLTKGLASLGLRLGSSSQGLLTAGCIVAAWLLYRLFLRRTLIIKQKSGDDGEVTM